MKPLVLTEGAGVPEVSESMQCLDPFCPMNKIQDLWADGPGNLKRNQVQGNSSLVCLASCGVGRDLLRGSHS